MSKKLQSKKMNELFYTILSLKNLGEARRFFRDLLTEAELSEFGNRWKVAQMLSRKVPYSTIEKQTGMSSTTIARINKWLEKGMNGYKLLLKRQQNNNHTHHELKSSFEDDS